MLLVLGVTQSDAHNPAWAHAEVCAAATMTLHVLDFGLGGGTQIHCVTHMHLGGADTSVNHEQMRIHMES